MFLERDAFDALFDTAPEKLVIVRKVILITGTFEWSFHPMLISFKDKLAKNCGQINFGKTDNGAKQLLTYSYSMSKK